MRNIRKAAIAAAWSAIGILPSIPASSAMSHKVGLTSYWHLPFQSQVFEPCWGCSGGLDPTQLFFSANPNSQYLNSTLMAEVRSNTALITAKGLVPTSGAQRWEDTWEASQPASLFPGEPSWVESDRLNAYGAEGGGGPLTSQPEFVAWAAFITQHPQYWDIAYDGGLMPNQPNYFRSWHSQWGYISPLTQLDQVDCPADMPNGCTWGDLWAYRWAKTSAVTGGFGITLSDGTDGQPTYGSYLHDFNPRIVAEFAAKYGYEAQLKGLSSAQAATWINGHAYPQWNDLLSIGYGKFYNALASRMGAATSHQALVIDQCSVTPSFRRFSGTDQRIISQNMDPKSYLCIWDNQSIARGRPGPIASPPAQALAGAVMAAARTPWVRNGANLEAPDAPYWAAIASFYPSLSGTEQTEVGTKLIKRLWLWEAWAHVATLEGGVRRALALVARDYWDVGSLASLDPLTSLIDTIVPRAPVGPALYYSVSVERAVEATEPQAGQALSPYLQWPALQQFIDGGGGFGYYVSDATLPTISAAAHNAPSAWVVIDAQNMMPAAEMQKLQSIAPVVTSTAALAALPNQPFHLSGGLTGFAFKDQIGRTIMVISNPSTLPTATTVNGTVTLAGLTAAHYIVTNMFTNQVQTLPTSGGKLVAPLSLSRWDTQVFSLKAD